MPYSLFLFAWMLHLRLIYRPPHLLMLTEIWHLRCVLGRCSGSPWMWDYFLVPSVPTGSRFDLCLTCVFLHSHIGWDHVKIRYAGKLASKDTGLELFPLSAREHGFTCQGCGSCSLESHALRPQCHGLCQAADLGLPPFQMEPVTQKGSVPNPSPLRTFSLLL